jgi:Zn-dependent protease with chaperone function
LLNVSVFDFAMTVLSRSKKAAVRGKEWFSTHPSISARHSA